MLLQKMISTEIMKSKQIRGKCYASHFFTLFIGSLTKVSQHMHIISDVLRK